MERTFCIDLTPTQKVYLLGVARQSIASGLHTGEPLSLDSGQLAGILAAELASFVTLQRAGDLRGCVGSLEPKGPLAQGVSTMAYHAAFRDSRFPPLASDELAQLHIEVSILSVPEPIDCNSETDLLAQLVPAEDGLLLEDGDRRVTFLPKVWDRLDDPAVFVRHLKEKAGWPADYWSTTMRAHRYRTVSFAEAAIAA
jgi:AmmeMemoRadiSam system protein A